jgi:hypothetical protein
MNVRNLMMGAAALATAAAARQQPASSTALIQSPAATGLNPIPFGLPAEMTARFDQVQGSGPSLPLDIMNRIIDSNGLLNSTKLANEMARSSPEAIFEAINQASWCGGRGATMAESLQSCIRVLFGNPNEVPPNFPNPTRAQAESVNMARLAFQV